MAPENLVVIRTFSNAFEAEVAKSALDAIGVDSMIRSDDAGGLQPGLWPASGVQLLVREEDRQRADEVLTPRSDRA